MSLFRRVADRIVARAQRRAPDFIVGGDSPYLMRWWVLPRNPLFNVYVHQFLRDDDDRALHDHPWPWCSILLRGIYLEHTIDAGGIHRKQIRSTGSIRVASPWRAHRIELQLDSAGNSVPCWTLFITGPRLRNWGFHCAEQGWIRWQDFVATDDRGAVGRGCGDEP